MSWLKKINFERDGVLYAFLLFVIYALIFRGEVFHNPQTWRLLLSQNADIGIIAVGMTLVIIGGGIDLSVGSMLALIGVVGLSRMGTQPVAVGVLWMVGCGAALGLIQGVVITWGRVVPFVATLVGLLVYRSLALAMASGATLPSKNPAWADLASQGVPLPFVLMPNGKPMIIYWSIFLFIGVALVLGFVLNMTPYGRRLVAVGSNEKAAKYSAVNVGAIRRWSYVILGICVGLAAWVNSSKLSSVPSSTAGQLAELEAIAAVVIGGTALSGGRGRIWGTVVGVMILGMISTMLVAEGVSAYWQGVVKGGIILVAVLISRGKKAD
jgi:ribose transport system permease protein